MPVRFGPFSQVAAMAGQSKIGSLIRATMLLCNDVFEVVNEMAVLFSKQAVLTAISGPPPDDTSNLGVNQG
jgi:hypothetical protein